MKRVLSIVLAFVFVASGCSNNQSATNVPSKSPTIATSTKVAVMPSLTPTVTQTLLPAATSTLAITPTFDPSTIITQTPSTAAQCPQITDIQVPKFSKPDYSFLTFQDQEKAALDFLNQGGDPELLTKALVSTRWLKRTETSVQTTDVTGDGVSEIIISPSETYIIGCNSGEYEILLKIDNEGIAINSEQNQIVAVEDMNLDGIHELAVATYGCGGMGDGMCLDGWVYEWNGNQFTTIAEVSLIGRQTSGDQPIMEVKNANDDDLLELTVSGGILGGNDYYYFFPWRQETDIYGWNGNEFVLQNISFSNPQFRYQVIQDADRAVLNGEYDEAIKMYQNAIYGNYDWFSEERKQYIFDNANGIPNLTQPDPEPKEQPNLAGYAFFRIMVANILQGNIEEAQTAYDRVHKNFSKGSPGYDYVIIADGFWNEYQSNQDIEKACREATNYVMKVPDILKYLGSDYHNSFQDIMYEPSDICPFEN